MSSQVPMGLPAYLQREEERAARVHIIAKGTFGKNVMKNVALPESETLSVEFLDEQQVSQYESEKLDLLFIISEDFDWLYVQNYQDVEVQMIVGSRPYRGLVKPHSCFMYGQPVEQYRIMIQGILNALFLEELISIDYGDLKTLTEKGGTGVIASSFRAGDQHSRRAEQAADAVLMQLKEASSNFRQIQGCLINIIGNENLELGEVQTLMDTFMASNLNQDAIILMGAGFDNSLDGIQVNVIAVV